MEDWVCPTADMDVAEKEKNQTVTILYTEFILIMFEQNNKDRAHLN
jgi:hypothetical protein